MKLQDWVRATAPLDYAFQPIVNIHSGICLGYEALLRGWDAAGFTGIHDVFDAAYADQTLFTIELILREKAVRKFATIPFHRRIKLFFNIDNRVLAMPDYSTGSTAQILRRYRLHPDAMVLELSEKHDLSASTPATQASLTSYKKQAYKLAIDDFGTGYSGLQLLYNSEPDFIKIDRFFIADMAADSKKRLFVAKVLNLAHTLGIMVIAEGVETVSEYSCCKDIGCDYIQGYLVQEPTMDAGALVERHESISRLASADRRDKSVDHVLLNQGMDYVEPIRLHPDDTGYLTDMATVFEFFKRHKSSSFFPVINGNDAPLGLIRENEIKEYVYSKYGKDLLLNKAAGKTLLDFVVKCPIADVNSKIESVLEFFALDSATEGVLLTENGRYAGFLSARSLLRVINEKNIAMARDQNPLTRLPGNAVIGEYLEGILDDPFSTHVVVYFDLDNFKAFNDVYGFRRGDRAILLFADILKEAMNARPCFVGHIGGDDFFTGITPQDFDIPRVLFWIRGIIDKFQVDVLSLYDPPDRHQGFVEAPDRDGIVKRFPLLTASAAVLHVREGTRGFSGESLGAEIARLKKEAKRLPERMAVATLGARASMGESA